MVCSGILWPSATLPASTSSANPGTANKGYSQSLSWVRWDGTAARVHDLVISCPDGWSSRCSRRFFRSLDLSVIYTPKVRCMEDPPELAWVVIGIEPDRPDQRLNRLTHHAGRDRSISQTGAGQDARRQLNVVRESTEMGRRGHPRDLCVSRFYRLQLARGLLPTMTTVTETCGHTSIGTSRVSIFEQQQLQDHFAEVSQTLVAIRRARRVSSMVARTCRLRGLQEIARVLKVVIDAILQVLDGRRHDTVVGHGVVWWWWGVVVVNVDPSALYSQSSTSTTLGDI